MTGMGMAGMSKIDFFFAKDKRAETKFSARLLFVSRYCNFRKLCYTALTI